MKIESGPDLAGRKPDAFEMKLRFACGALLGLLVGLGICVRVWPLGAVGVTLLVGGAMVICAVCAARFGDRFWAQLHWLR